MEVKTKQSRSHVELDKGKRKSLFGFIGELKEELKKVSWTTKAELQFCTKVVVGAIFLFGLGIYGVDLVIQGGLTLIKSFVYLIFG